MARALLHGFDAFHAAPPETDVEDHEDDEQHGADERGHGVLVAAAGGEVGGDHEEGVVGAVEEHGIEEGVEEVAPTAGGVELGQREVVAHGHGEEEMGRDGEDAAHEGRGEGVGAAEDVAHILDTGEAQREVDGVDDAVEVFVELGAAPDDPHQEEQLAELLAEAGHEVAVEDAVEHREAGRRWGEGHQERLEEAGRQHAEAAHEECQQELANGLGVVLVLAIDEDEEQHHGQNGRYEDDIHNVIFFKTNMLQTSNEGRRQMQR